MPLVLMRIPSLKRLEAGRSLRLVEVMKRSASGQLVEALLHKGRGSIAEDSSSVQCVKLAQRVLEYALVIEAEMAAISVRFPQNRRRAVRLDLTKDYAILAKPWH